MYAKLAVAVVAEFPCSWFWGWPRTVKSSDKALPLVGSGIGPPVGAMFGRFVSSLVNGGAGLVEGPFVCAIVDEGERVRIVGSV